MHSFDLILTLAGGLTAALVFVGRELGLLTAEAANAIVAVAILSIVQGIRAVYGDATHRDTLAQAGAAKADNLIVTSAGMADGRETIRHAKELNPDIHVLARAAYLRDLPALRQAGAHTVVSGESEVALALTEVLLHRLGATPDQIDHERERVRSELLAMDPGGQPQQREA